MVHQSPLDESTAGSVDDVTSAVWMLVAVMAVGDVGVRVHQHVMTV